MDAQTKLNLLQTTYAASIAEAVNTYSGLSALDAVVERRKKRQAQTAPLMNRQLDIRTPEDIFLRLSEAFGCADWTVEKTPEGLTATASSCKLCTLSKRMGGANPCRGWCLDPMIAMLTNLPETPIREEDITVRETLMEGSRCRVEVRMKNL